MKKLLLLVVAAVCAVTASAQEPGGMNLGPRLSIYTNTGDTVLGVGAVGRYRFDSNWRIEPSITALLHNGCSLDISCDAHYVFDMGVVRVYPAAGLTVNAKRQEILDFSTSYYNASQMIVCKADDTTFDDCKTADDVIAKLNAMDASVKAGVQSGTTGQFFCEGDPDWGFDGFDFTTVPLANGALAVQDVLNGNLKFVVIDEGPAKAIAAKVNAAN
jgi:hypothetical protein